VVKLEKLCSHVVNQYLAKDVLENECVFEVAQFFALSKGTQFFCEHSASQQRS